MSARKKSRSGRDGIRPSFRHIAISIAGLAVVVAILIAAIALSPVRDLAGGSDSSVLHAAIVDQLSLTAPNQGFVDDASDQLRAAGYTVDYYQGADVTVEFYRDLPKRDYDVLILRTHSTAAISQGDETVSSISLFTNEPYSETKYAQEQAQGRLGAAFYEEGGPEIFGVLAGFIANSMKGRFDDTVVVMMGCDGLSNDEAAKAFIEKGASTYISWSEFVSASHTDAATDRLLEHLLDEGLPPWQAVAATMAEVGPDPYYGAILKSYPSAP
jgi:hypothetical protein